MAPYASRPMYSPLQSRMPQQQEPTLSYQEWLAMRGMGQQQPQQQTPQVPQMPKAPLKFGDGPLSKLLFGGGGGAAGAELLPGGSLAGAGSAGEAGISGAGAAGELPTMGATPFAVPAAVAAATILGGRYGLRALQGKTKNWKDASLADNAGRVITGVATGGLSEVANKFLGGHKSTRERQAGVTKELLSSSDDPAYQNFIQGMRKQFESAPPDPSKPFAGKYANWDEYKKAGFEANDLTGTEAAIRAGGVEYAKLAPEQRAAFVQRLIDENLLQSKSGGVISTNEARAKQLFEEEKAGGFKTAVRTPGTPVSAAPGGMTGVSRSPQDWGEIHSLPYIFKPGEAPKIPIARSPEGAPPVARNPILYLGNTGQRPPAPTMQIPQQPYTGRSAAERIAARQRGGR